MKKIFLLHNMALQLSIPDTRDLEKTRSGKLSYQGLIPGKRVTRGLFVGSAPDSANIEFMRRNSISVVVNCTRDLPFRFPKQTHIRLPVDDAYAHTLRLFDMWKAEVPRISRHLDQHRNVLIHCFCCQQRSIATAAAVLMYRENMPAAKVIERMKKLKADAFWPRVNFYRSLMRWQTWIKQHPPARVSRSL